MVLASDIFHVHTFRCRHAEDISDKEYIEKAIELGATGIWFTDHAPFPGDPFGNRMKYSELEEYVSTLLRYKEIYSGTINVHIGLEIEYFPSYRQYYEELYRNPDIEILLLGQHMAEDGSGKYTFSWEKDRLEEEEYKALGHAVVEGIQSGFFGAVAHPDRIFRRKKNWDSDMQAISMEIIEAARQQNIPLEVNISSLSHKHHYWPEFWNLVPSDICRIFGTDAHSIKELIHPNGLITKDLEENNS